MYPTFYKNICCIFQAAKNFHGAASQHIKDFVPAIRAAVVDINLRVKYAAERAFKYLAEVCMYVCMYVNDNVICAQAQVEPRMEQLFDFPVTSYCL